MNTVKPNLAEFDMPENLSEDGVKAYQVIQKHFKNFNDMQPAGCKAFYSAKEWKARKEHYGTDSLLVVVYEGSELRYHFDVDACYESNEMVRLMLGDDEVDFEPSEVEENFTREYDALCKTLDDAGYYLEPCTRWYSAVYKKK